MILRSLTAPMWRFRQEAEWTIPAAALAALSAWQDRSLEVLAALLVGLAVAAAVDSAFGRRRARFMASRGEEVYDPIYAAMGLHSKMLGLILVVLLRGGEWIVALIGVDTHGVASVVFAGVLFVRELKSIDGHRVAFGGGPVPLLHHFLSGVERLLEFTLGQSSGEPRRREHDRKKPLPTTPES